MKRYGKSRSSKPKPHTDGKTCVSDEAVQQWGGGRGITLLAMVFLSGFACLIYQILWMRQLGLFFGNTSHAAALTLAVFFAGLAGGGWFWGKRSARIANPLKTYAWLELGIAVAGATHLNMQELMLPIKSQTILLFYCGNITLAADLFAAGKAQPIQP